MGSFIKGDIVVVPFPFSDLTQNKRRPAYVVTIFHGDDILLSLITSVDKNDPLAIPLHNSDFTSGQLSKLSYIRPNRLFTADSNIVAYQAGHVKDSIVKSVNNKIIEIIES